MSDLVSDIIEYPTPPESWACNAMMLKAQLLKLELQMEEGWCSPSPKFDSYGVKNSGVMVAV